MTTIATLARGIGAQDGEPMGSTLRTLRLFEDADVLFGNSVGRYYGGALTAGEVAWLLRPQPGDRVRT